VNTTSIQRHGIHTLRSPVNPMMPVGSNARHAQCASGYQYQNCAKSVMPMIAAVFLLPARLCKLIVTFRPPASISPCPSAAPNRAIGSSCLSATILAYRARVVAM
jgi:hypothetical protein